MAHYDSSAVNIPFNPFALAFLSCVGFSNTQEFGRQWNVDNEPDRGNPLPSGMKTTTCLK